MDVIYALIVLLWDFNIMGRYMFRFVNLLDRIGILPSGLMFKVYRLSKLCYYTYGSLVNNHRTWLRKLIKVLLWRREIITVMGNPVWFYIYTVSLARWFACAELVIFMSNFSTLGLSFSNQKKCVALGFLVSFLCYVYIYIYI